MESDDRGSAEEWGRATAEKITKFDKLLFIYVFWCNSRVSAASCPVHDGVSGMSAIGMRKVSKQPVVQRQAQPATAAGEFEAGCDL